MSRKKKKKRRNSRSRAAATVRSTKKATAKVSARPPEESQSAVAVTVAWMLCCLATGGGLLMFCLARVVRTRWDDDQALAIASAFQFMALMTGTLALVLTWGALKVRRTPPPPIIVWGAIAIGILPFAIFAAGVLLGS